MLQKLQKQEWQYIQQYGVDNTAKTAETGSDNTNKYTEIETNSENTSVQ